MKKKNKKIDPLKLIKAEFGTGISPYAEGAKQVILDEGQMPLMAATPRLEDLTPVANTDLIDLNQFNNPMKKVRGRNQMNFTPGPQIGNAANAALLGINALLPEQRTRNPIVRPELNLSYNANPYGTGSQALAKNGKTMKKYQNGGDPIKGKRTKGNLIMPNTSAKDAEYDLYHDLAFLAQSPENLNSSIGRSFLSKHQARYDKKYIQDVLTDMSIFNQNPEINSLMGKDRVSRYFAQPSTNPQLQQLKMNKAYDPLAVLNNSPEIIQNPVPVYSKLKHGGKVKPLASNAIEFVGPSHEDGGIPISYNGQKVEVEGGEPAFKSLDGSLNIMGNMYVPGTKKKFKTATKELADLESNIDKQMVSGIDMIESNSPKNRFELLSFNTGRAKEIGARMKKALLEETKQSLADTQNQMLAYSEKYDLDPEEFSKGNLKKARHGVKMQGKTFDNFGTAEDGKTVDPVPGVYKEIIKLAARRAGIDENVFSKLVSVESGFNPKAQSNAGAKGIVQFMPATAKEYGITEEKLLSDDQLDMQDVADAGAKHFSKLLKANNDDYRLALAAYNGGQGAVNFVKKQLGKSNITGEDWVKFMEERNVSNPTQKKSAWQTQTLDYVKKIGGHGNNDNFHNNIAKEYRENYYSPNKNDKNSPSKSTKKREITPFTKTYLQDLTPSPKINSQIPKSSVPGVEPPDVPDFNVTERDRPSNQEGLLMSQVLPELYAFATNKVQPVFQQTFQPELLSPYQVSFQDRLNENQATFSALQKVGANNPAALSSLAAQKYSADNSVLAEEFRTNQSIFNQITNQNTSILNDAKLKNLGLADQQYVRQEQARANTRNQNQVILNSLSSKSLQNRLENRRLGLYENLYNYRFDPVTGQAMNYNPEASSNFYGGNNQTNDNVETEVSTKFDQFNQMKGRTEKVKRKAPIEIRKRKNGGTIGKMYDDFYNKLG